MEFQNQPPAFQFAMENILCKTIPVNLKKKKKERKKEKTCKPINCNLKFIYSGKRLRYGFEHQNLASNAIKLVG